MYITKLGCSLSLLAAVTLLGIPALAKTGAPRLKRVHRLYYHDLVPKNVAFAEGPSRYALTFKRLHRGTWEKRWSSPRFAEINSRDRFSLQGIIAAHNGRDRTSVLTNGRRVTPYKNIQVKIEGRVPRKGSRKRRKDLPWITVLPVDTDLPAIRRLARQKGWSDYRLDIGPVKVQYSTDGGKTWKKHTQHRGDVELHDVSPRDRLRYRAIVPLRAYSQGGRRFEGKESMVFAGEL